MTSPDISGNVQAISQMDTASVNRRKYPRQPISLSALVHPNEGRSWLCTIRDFCQEGMLLTGTGGSRSLAATGAEAQPGEQVALHFSVATPNGQAAFLFLLTSALAPLIRLSYGRMVIMALPYTITMSIAALLALWFLGGYSPGHHVG